MSQQPHVEWFRPTCQIIQHFLGDHDLIAALSPAQIRQMAEHLESCEDCADAFHEYEEVDHFIGSLAQDPPAILAQGLLSEFWKTAELKAPARDVACLDLGLSYRPLGTDDYNEALVHETWELMAAAVSDVSVTASASDSHNTHRSQSHPTPAPATWPPSDAPVAPDLLVSARRNRLQNTCYLDTPECVSLMEHIVGPENVMRALLQLLDLALDHDIPVIGYITITWLRDDELLEDAHPLWQDWRRALRKALDHGWNVRHLVRASSHVDKSVHISEYMRNFLGAPGKYEPCMLPEDSDWTVSSDAGDTSDIASEFMVITDVGGIQILAPDNAHITQCRLIPPGDALDLTEFGLARGAARAERIIGGVYESPSDHYPDAIYDIEQHPGARLAVINGLGETIIPNIVHEQRATALATEGEPEGEIAHTLRMQINRRRAMERNLKRFLHIDVCPLSALDRFIKTGIYEAQDIWAARGAPPLVSVQVWIVLQSLIDLLTTQPKYYFWLLDDPYIERDLTEFVVKEGYKAMTEFWVTDALGQRKRVDLEIVDLSIVQSLRSRSYWSHLEAHAITDKKQVIHTLQTRLALVSRRL